MVRPQPQRDADCDDADGEGRGCVHGGGDSGWQGVGGERGEGASLLFGECSRGGGPAIISNCGYHRNWVRTGYGEEGLQAVYNESIINSGAILGKCDAIAKLERLMEAAAATGKASTIDQGHLCALNHLGNISAAGISTKVFNASVGPVWNIAGYLHSNATDIARDQEGYIVGKTGAARPHGERVPTIHQYGYAPPDVPCGRIGERKTDRLGSEYRTAQVRGSCWTG